MIRRYGQPPRPNRHYTRRPGVYAVLLRGSEMLLTHQAEPEPEIQLPGGGIEKGEHPIAALTREVLEETGWHISPARRIGTFRRFTFMPEYDLWAEKICTLYIARPTLRLSAPTEAGHTAFWAPADVVPSLLANPGDAALLRKFLNRN